MLLYDLNYLKVIIVTEHLQHKPGIFYPDFSRQKSRFAPTSLNDGLAHFFQKGKCFTNPKQRFVRVKSVVVLNWKMWAHIIAIITVHSSNMPRSSTIAP